jgi:hypothetical protein
MFRNLSVYTNLQDKLTLAICTVSHKLRNIVLEIHSDGVHSWREASYKAIRNYIHIHNLWCCKQSKVRMVLVRLNTGDVGSNTARRMDEYSGLYVLAYLLVIDTAIH